MTAKFRAAPDLEGTIKRLDVVRAGVYEAAAAVQAAAIARAEAHRDTGEYINRLKIDDRDDFGFAVVAGAYYSNWVEYGTGSRRSPVAPTPCPHPEPKETGVHPQFIMTGAIADVTR